MISKDIEFVCGCCMLVAIDIWAGYSIYQIMSRDWQPVPGGCVVHGAWIEMHWRTTSCGETICDEQSWEYHFEVSSKAEWPRTDACLYEDCSLASYASWDDAAWHLNDLLKGQGKAAGCEVAGYEFDDGLLEFVDTDPTNAHLRHGVNCHRPGEPAPAARVDPAPPPTPADPLSYAAQEDAYGFSTQGVQPPPAPPLAAPQPSGIGGEGYGYQTSLLGMLGGGSSPSDFPGATVGGGPLRRGPPCECAESYPCFFDAASAQPENSIKMSEGRDPTLGYWILLVLFGFCPCTALCVIGCGKIGYGPTSAASRFERQFSAPPIHERQYSAPPIYSA